MVVIVLETMLADVLRLQDIHIAKTCQEVRMNLTRAGTTDWNALESLCCADQTAIMLDDTSKGSCMGKMGHLSKVGHRPRGVGGQLCW